MLPIVMFLYVLSALTSLYIFQDSLSFDVYFGHYSFMYGWFLGFYLVIVWDKMFNREQSFTSALYNNPRVFDPDRPEYIMDYCRNELSRRTICAPFVYLFACGCYLIYKGFTSYVSDSPELRMGISILGILTFYRMYCMIFKDYLNALAVDITAVYMSIPVENKDDPCTE